MAKLSDIYGRKSIYVLDILLFAIGSFITITSFSIDMLILGRAIQGIGAGGIFPVANAFIGDIFPPERRGGALGILSSIWGVSFVLGPILGGLLLNHGWQWLFIINIPVAVIVIIASLYILPKTDRNRMINFDWLGIITLSVLVSSLAYGINQINTNNFLVSITSLQVWPFLILAAVLLPVLWKVEEAAQDPLIQVDLFKSKEVKLITSIMVGTGLVQASTIFVPVFVIVALSFSITNASLMLLPIVLTMAIGGPIIGRLLDRYGSRNIMFTGTFIMIIGLFILSIFSKSFYLFVIGEILIGIGMSTAIGSPPRYIMLIESPPKERAAGQGLINIITSGGQLIGGALIGAVIGSYAGNLIGYQLAYLLIGFVAIFMTILTIGLKVRKSRVKPWT
ncbi:MAG: MFS transporter [Methanobacterium sp.]